MNICTSGKKIYATQALGEDALIEAHSRTFFPAGQGPVAVYLCDRCGTYHLTSKGKMNERLAKAMLDGSLKRLRDAAEWERKLRK